MKMVVYPAIDLRAGRVVRLSQGDFGEETIYDGDPARIALEFERDGAEWLHVVDLDAARGSDDNRAVIDRMAADLTIPLQVGGGVRDASLLRSGVARVVVGSLLLQDRAAAARLLNDEPDRVAFGLDHRDGELRVSGWKASSGLKLASVLEWDEVARAAAVIVTDIATDGMLGGPNLGVLSDTVDRCPAPVICSGGVGSLDDLRRVRDAGAAGVIIGRAIYEKRFTLREALAAAL